MIGHSSPMLCFSDAVRTPLSSSGGEGCDSIQTLPCGHYLRNSSGKKVYHPMRHEIVVKIGGKGKKS